MISINTFLKNVQAIKDTKPTYKLGQDGSNGECDCIGLVIGAVRRSGTTWSGTHGSNWAARNKMAVLQPSPPIELGGIMYKAWRPTDSQWNLPDVYKDPPDQLDYYHVGVVTQVSPLRITHCTKSATVDGITVDTKIGVWRYGGRLDGLDYDNKEDPPMEPTKAIVIAETGGSVRMRARPNNTSVILANIPLDTEIDVLQQSGEWSEIKYQGMLGWMMSRFLKAAAGDIGTPGEPTLEQKVAILWRAYTNATGA